MFSNLETINNIDFDLRKGASISGKIVDAVTELATQKHTVLLLFNEINQYLTAKLIYGTNVDAQATGEYFIGGLLPGSYYLQGGDNGSDFYQREVFANKPCYWSNCDRSTGDAIVVGELEQATDIDFFLEKGSKISGSIISDITGLTITDATKNVQVQFFDSSGVVVGGSRTSPHIS